MQRNGIRTAAHRQTLCPAASIGLQRRSGPGIFSQISAHRCTLPVVICQRHFGIFGFFNILKQKLKEEVEKNEDFRNKVKTAQDTDTMKKAAVAAAATKVGTSRLNVFFNIVKLPSGICGISGCDWRCGRRESCLKGWAGCIGGRRRSASLPLLP